MGRRIIITEEERKNIKFLYEDFDRNDNGQIIAGNNVYEIFVDGTQRFYGGKTNDGKYKICNKADVDSWTTFCQEIDIDPNNVKRFDDEMNRGESVIVHTTPEEKKVEFRKV